MILSTALGKGILEKDHSNSKPDVVVADGHLEVHETRKFACDIPESERQLYQFLSALLVRVMLATCVRVDQDIVEEGIAMY